MAPNANFRIRGKEAQDIGRTSRIKIMMRNPFKIAQNSFQNFWRGQAPFGPFRVGGPVFCIRFRFRFRFVFDFDLFL